MTEPTPNTPRAQLARLHATAADLEAAYLQSEANIKWASACPADIPALIETRSKRVADIEAIERQIAALAS